VDGNASQVSLDGGRLRLPVLGVANANNQHLSLRPLLFNGTVIEAVRSTDLFMNLSEASAAPLLCQGGAILTRWPMRSRSAVKVSHRRRVQRSAG
jgi:hypothetical protein